MCGNTRGDETGWRSKITVTSWWMACVPLQMLWECASTTHGNDEKGIHFEGRLTVHLPHEIIWNANWMQQGNFIDVFLARHVSGTYAHHQEHQMLSCSIWFSTPCFWMGGVLESLCVGRVYGADGAVWVAWHHPHRTHDLRSGSQDTTHPNTRCTKPYAATQHLMFLMMGVCTRNMSS